jgi:hypothetical protein
MKYHFPEKKTGEYPRGKKNRFGLGCTYSLVSKSDDRLCRYETLNLTLIGPNRTKQTRNGVFDSFFLSLGRRCCLRIRIRILIDHNIRWASFTAACRRNSQILLVLPRPRPKLAGPSLEGDRANSRTILIPNDLSPGASIRRANLRGTLAHAEQPLTRRSQACHRSPVLSATRSTTHRLFTPARRVGIRAAEPRFSA